MSIWIIDGKPGHGKTTFATREALKWQAYYKRTKREPRTIYSNVPIHLPGVELLTHWKDIRNVRHGILIIDEAASWFSNTSFAEQDEFLEFFSQHRKEGNTLYLIAQHAEMLNKTIRERTCEGVWHIKRMFGPNEFEEPSGIERKLGWWAMASRYDAYMYGKTRSQHMYRRLFFRIDKLHGMFDTLARVGKRNSENPLQRGAGLAAQTGRAEVGGGLAPTPAPPSASPIITLSGLPLTREDYDTFTETLVPQGNGRTYWTGPTTPEERQRREHWQTLLGPDLPALSLHDLPIIEF